jgi:DNA-binding NtrC family response regulator
MVLKTTDDTPSLILPSAERYHRIAILYSHGEQQPENTKLYLSPGEEKTIGRDPAKARFVLYDSSVSRLHARVRYEGRKWRIKNESTRGTFVNGKRVRGWAELTDNAIIRIGATLAEFSEDGDVRDAAPLKGLLGGLAFKTRLLFQQLRRAAATDDTVFLSGPTGSGKTTCAEAIHRESGRKEHAFKHFSCNAFPENLIESELFGHAAGAFTGAKTSRLGLFRSAESGTLFIDEIGELTPSLQVKLLLALESSTIKPVGSDKDVPFDARIIVATHRDLPATVKAGSFRADLYYRLTTKLQIEVPSLHERRADVPSIVASTLGTDHWLWRGCAFALLNALLLKEWDGNLRELINYVQSRIKPLRPENDGFAAEKVLKLLEEHLPSKTTLSDDRLIALLRQHKGNLTHVANAAGCTRQAIQKRMKKLKLRAADYSGPGPSRRR